MALNCHFTLNYVFCHVKIQDLLIYLYGQRHYDVYGRENFARRSTRHSEKAVTI